MAKLTKTDILENPPPIIFLYGADAFSIDEFYSSLIKQLIKTDEDFFDYIYIDADDSSQDLVATTASQIPMFAQKRIVVVRRFHHFFADKRKKNNVLPALKRYLENPNDSTILILLAQLENTKIDLTKSPYNLIKEYSIEFPTVYENQLAKWVVNRFATHNVTVNLETADLIVSQTDPDLRNLANEIEKILLFHLDKKNITTQDVISMSGNSRQNTVFELVKAISNKSLELSLEILNNILANSNQEMLILALLRDFFVKTWKLQEIQSQASDRNELAKKIGLRSSYFLSDYTNAARKYSASKISETFNILATTDSMLKSTHSNSKLIMEKMLIDIIS